MLVSLWSAILIGCIENGQSVAGVVYDPYKDELFEAETGKGAKRNGLLIHVSDQQAIEGASIGTSNSYAYHHNGLKPWDNAAAFLIIREAGGVVQTLTGEEALFTTSHVLCGTPAVVAQLREVFSKIDPELLTSGFLWSP